MSEVLYNDKLDRRISWALMWSFIATTINYVIKSVFPISGNLWSFLSILTGGSILLAYTLCFRVVTHRATKPLIGSLIVFSLVYFVSCLQCSLRGEPINLVAETARSTFLLYIPAGVFSVAVCDKKILYDIMLKASILISVLLLFRMVISFNPLYDNESESEYSMSFGYRIIAPALLHLNAFFRSNKKSLLLLFIVEFICIIIYANRGVLLSVFAFLLYESLFGIKKTSTKVVFAFSTICIAFVFFFYGNSILLFLFSLLEKNGISSRTLYMLLSDSIGSDSGRLDLYKVSLEMITDKPLFGWGVGGEYYHFNLFLHNDVPNIYCTSHNGVLQALVQLGVFFGVILSLLVILPIFRAHRIKDSYLREIIVVYFCAYAVPCITVSSGFLVQPEIAIYMYLYYFSPKRLRYPNP